MTEEAVARAGPNGRIALLASFPATLRSMPQEFTHVTLGVTVVTALATDALSLPKAAVSGASFWIQEDEAIEPVIDRRA